MKLIRTGVLIIFILLFGITFTHRALAQNYTTENNIIYKDGQPIRIHGIGWFGFESKLHVIQGLWERKWQDMILQIKETGFTAVRVPFCPTTLKNVELTQGIDYSINPDLWGKKSLEIMDLIVTAINNEGLYILLDHHHADCEVFEPLWYNQTYTEQDWIADLTFVMDRYSDLENIIGIELKNEPFGPAKWGGGDQDVNWKAAAERAGKAVIEKNPNKLIFVEGIEYQEECSDNTFAHFWGGNLQPIKCYPISSEYIPKNKLVLAPHVYGPGLYMQDYFKAPNFPENMPSIWDLQWKFAVDDGYSVVITEWGGHYGNTGPIEDRIWQDKFVDYKIEHKLCNQFYWSWNPNSFNTSGILKDDWTNVWDNKVALLDRLKSLCQQNLIKPSPSLVFLDADINQDHTVNISDFGLLQNEFGAINPNTKRADINKDGLVNISDFSILAADFGKTTI